jgi:CHAT domain-containing protein
MLVQGGASAGDKERTLLRQLYDQRLQPLDQFLQGSDQLPAVTRLVILPGGPMTGIPIEALTDRYTISYGPSATVFAKLREQRQPIQAQHREQTGAHLLAIGDPSLNPPAAHRLRHEADDPLHHIRGQHLEPLPFARHEVHAIAALFPKSTVLIGSQARAERLEELVAKDQLRQYRYLHFATHGLLNDRIALQSALVLAQDNLPDSAAQVLAHRKTLDGLVTAAWIRTDWERRLDAELVVLSACHSGQGKYAGGEGFVGFSQALLLAGARSLVLSQWQVDDKATALLMKRFYENLLGSRPDQRQPLPKAMALKEAKAWLRGLTTDQAESELRKLAGGVAQGRVSTERGQPVEKKGAPVAGHPYAHPYYWAAFVLVGDPE